MLLTDNLEKGIQKDSIKIYRTFLSYVQKSRVKLNELEGWFDNMSDRLSERFALRSRLISVGISLVIALAIQLDAISLMKNVYVDANLRTRLVVAADMALPQGENILGAPNVYDLAMDSLRSEDPNIQTSPFPRRHLSIVKLMPKPGSSKMPPKTPMSIN